MRTISTDVLMLYLLFRFRLCIIQVAIEDKGSPLQKMVWPNFKQTEENFENRVLHVCRYFFPKYHCFIFFPIYTRDLILRFNRFLLIIIIQLADS